MHKDASDFYWSASKSDWYFILTTGLILQSIYWTVTCNKNLNYSSFIPNVAIWFEVWEIIIYFTTFRLYFLQFMMFVLYFHSLSIYSWIIEQIVIDIESNTYWEWLWSFLDDKSFYDMCKYMGFDYSSLFLYDNISTACFLYRIYNVLVVLKWK